MVVLGVILIIVAVIVVGFYFLSAKPKLEKLISSERVSIGETLTAYKETKSSLGELGKENVVSEDMTIMGRPECEDPLTSPLGQKPCLYYKYTVTETHYETHRVKDSDGRTRTERRRCTSTLEENSNSTRFYVDDGTGKMLVDPQDGSFEGCVKTIDKTDTQFSSSGPSVSFGGFSLNLGNMGDSRPESLHYEEWIIGFDRNVTVVGTLCDKMGDLLIEKSGDSSVLVSTKSQDEMIAETKSTMTMQKVAAAILAVLGIVCLLIGDSDDGTSNDGNSPALEDYED